MVRSSHKINVLLWSIKSIIKNFAKGKFKAMARLLYDSEYRKDVSYMLTLVRQKPLKLIDTEVALGNIVPGHAINYPEWVSYLRKRIIAYGPMNIPPIKVIMDVSKGKYLVVDGNHRLSALQKELSRHHRIQVQLLMEAK